MTAAFHTCRVGTGQQAAEGWHRSWLVLTKRTLQLSGLQTGFKKQRAILGNPNYPLFFFSPLLTFEWFGSFLTQCRWFSLCFGKKSHVRLQPRRKGWSKEGLRPRGWRNNVESTSRSWMATISRFPFDPGKMNPWLTSFTSFLAKSLQQRRSSVCSTFVIHLFILKEVHL